MKNADRVLLAALLNSHLLLEDTMPTDKQTTSDQGTNEILLLASQLLAILNRTE